MKILGATTKLKSFFASDFTGYSVASAAIAIDWWLPSMAALGQWCEAATPIVAFAAVVLLVVHRLQVIFRKRVDDE